MSMAFATSHYCCGVIEIGNFAYVKPKGPKGMSHYHKVGGTWQVQTAAAKETEDEFRKFLLPLTKQAGAIVTTTGADQEYMADILKACGFVEHKFHNRVHEKGEVSYWFLASETYQHVAPGEVKS